MSVFNPECASNYFQVLDIDPSECTGGNPYAFKCRIKVGERSFDFDGLDMGDLQGMKGAINKAMTHARRARREWEGAQNERHSQTCGQEKQSAFLRADR